ncbi:MAG: response regulator [bacterium]|nr:response regulator [bacterium]
MMNTSRASRVLLVDDDSRYLELVEMMLEGEDYVVQTECEGDRLREQALRFHPDVIVMDIMLQHQNGIDLAVQLRRTEEFEDVPIIFVSAWTGRAEQKPPRNSMRMFKPFSQTELVSAINTALRTGREIGDEHE